jgi:hypothetical protein
VRAVAARAVTGALPRRHPEVDDDRQAETPPTAALYGLQVVDAPGWELTAPESYVLLREPGSDPRAVDLALLELVDRAAVRPLEHQGRTGRPVPGDW